MWLGTIMTRSSRLSRRRHSQGIIESVNASEKVCPILVVKKKDGGICKCVNLWVPPKPGIHHRHFFTPTHRPAFELSQWSISFFKVWPCIRILLGLSRPKEPWFNRIYHPWMALSFSTSLFRSGICISGLPTGHVKNPETLSRSPVLPGQWNRLWVVSEKAWWKSLSSPEMHQRGWHKTLNENRF